MDATRRLKNLFFTLGEMAPAVAYNLEITGRCHINNNKNYNFVILMVTSYYKRKIFCRKPYKTFIYEHNGFHIPSNKDHTIAFRLRFCNFKPYYIL